MGRFLRIGLVRGGQVLDERFVPMGVDITVGKGAGNLFVVANGDLPKSTLVFKARGTDRHALMFTQPRGGVDLGNGEWMSLPDVVKNGMAAQRDNLYALPLPAQAYGKFELGDVTVLYQYKERDLVLSAASASVARGPLMLEAVLSWDDTVLSTKKVDPLRPLILGPGPLCDLQIPGRVLESRAYSLIAGADDRYYVDLRNPHLTVVGFEGKGRMEVEGPRERMPIVDAFTLKLAMPEGFSLELRYQPALARAASSPFDIQDPLPFMSLAGSAVFHALIMLIAFAVVGDLVEPKEVKAERRRELSVMLQEQKQEAQQREEEKAAVDKATKPEADKKDEPKKEEAKKVEPKKAEPKRESVTASRPAGDASPEARRTKVAEGVREKTFLNALGGQGDGSDSALPVGKETQYADAFNDVAGSYAVNGGDNDSAMAPPGPNSGDPNGSAYKKLSADEKGGSNIETSTANTGSKGADQETAVKINVRTGSLGSEGGVGKIDNSSVAGVFGRRKGAIKACYEKELRRNQNIKGRITLRFTIGTSGRITSIEASQNTTGDEAIASCIISKVRDWKFDPPSGGAVTFTYPFILEAR